MAEEPEQVLPEDRAAVLRREDHGAEPPVGLQHQQGGGQDGKASSTSTEVSRVFQVKIDIRNIVIPGARMTMIVVMKLTAPRMVPNRRARAP